MVSQPFDVDLLGLLFISGAQATPDSQAGPAGPVELVNDHDPFPLQNQFNFMKRGQFSWDYLQEGPDLWRVRIGKVTLPQPSSR